MANIPNKSDGQVLNAADLFKLVGTDLTLGTIDNSAVETNIGQVAMTASQVSQMVKVTAWVRFTVGTATDQKTGTFKLYSGTNAAFGSNTERASMVLSRTHTGAGTNFTQTEHATLSWVLTTEETWTNAIYIQITGQNSSAVSGDKCECIALIVEGV